MAKAKGKSAGYAASWARLQSARADLHARRTGDGAGRFVEPLAAIGELAGQAPEVARMQAKHVDAGTDAEGLADLYLGCLSDAALALTRAQAALGAWRCVVGDE